MLTTMINMYSDQLMRLTYAQELYIIIYYNMMRPAMRFFISSNVIGRSRMSFF